MGKENKAPADRLRYERTKGPILAAQSTNDPARRAFGGTNKVNVKGSILTAGHNGNRPSATSGLTQPKLNQNSALTRTYAIVPSKSNLNAAIYPKKQPNAGMQSSGRASSNAARTAVTKPNSRFSSSSNVAWSGPMKTVSVRMSLGPIVKTKTGLVPAATQPRNSQTQTHTHATAATNKVRSRTLASVSVSQRSVTAQRKTLPTTARNNPANERTTVSLTARSGIKVQNQDKSNSKQPLGKHSQPSSKSQLSSGLKSTSNSKCTAAPVKSEGRLGVSKTNKSAGQHTGRPTKQRSEREGEKNGQPCKVASRTSSGPVSSSRAASRVTPAPVAELGGKTKTCKETDRKKGHSSANAPPPQTGIKRIGVPVMSHTVPRPARTISHTGQATDMKTTKVPVRVIPQTEGKKLTAVQEERM